MDEKSKGIIRKVDELGRIVLPIDMRRKLDADYGKELEIFFDEDRVIIQKPRASCVICGTQEDIITVAGSNMCKACLSKITNAATGGPVPEEIPVEKPKRGRKKSI